MKNKRVALSNNLMLKVDWLADTVVNKRQQAKIMDLARECGFTHVEIKQSLLQTAKRFIDNEILNKKNEQISHLTIYFSGGRKKVYEVSITVNFKEQNPFPNFDTIENKIKRQVFINHYPEGYFDQ